MPQVVREARYFSHCEHGVEMGESINLGTRQLLVSRAYAMLHIPMASLDIMIITTCSIINIGPSYGQNTRIRMTYLSLPRLLCMTSQP